MKKGLILIALLIIGVIVYAQQPAGQPAANPAGGKAGDLPAVQAIPMPKSGTVQVVRDSSGKVVGINLIVASYKVVMNDVAKQLEALDGQKVKVLGTVMYDSEHDQRIITIQSIESAPTSGGGAAAPAANK